jgi:hypothetical protein
MNEIIATIISPLNTLFRYTCDNFVCRCKQNILFSCYSHICVCKTGLNKQHSREPSECSDTEINLTPTNEYKNVRFHIDEYEKNNKKI